MIDISTLTGDELRELLALTATRLAQLDQEAASTEEGLRAQIGATITSLATIIGPDAPTVKTANSLTEANLYTTADLSTTAAAGVALDKILSWMLVMARAQLATSRVVSGTID